MDTARYSKWSGGLEEVSGGLRTQEELQTARTELKEAQVKLIQQESALNELSNRGSCKQCPTSWLPFQGSCYFFSELQATWEAAQRNCADLGAHLVIVQGLDEQVRSLSFLTRNTRGRGYWLGLRAVRRGNKIQGYQWVDGVSLSFSWLQAASHVLRLALRMRFCSALSADWDTVQNLKHLEETAARNDSELSQNLDGLLEDLSNLKSQGEA
ncbi:C-type lectin domain family 4 member G [Pteropus alecto]|uniref:C-type lectin domain family 4 member G n=1 Tax=Pteropus alecto TaxID=9402 RepID=L5K8Q0_PTEAL|nr:C-type lectin domain family 4 member G [Pteropus alecto]